jgi:ATP-binding cassette subfamily F protein uup
VNLVNLELAAKAYHERVLLDQVSLGVSTGQRIGVVGRNGAGKTTLLSALAGAGKLDSGRATRGRDVTIGYLAQAEELTGTVGAIVLGDLAAHEWAADPRRRRPSAVRWRAPPDGPGRPPAGQLRPAAAGRAD